MNTEILIGFAGLVLGALIGGFFDFYLYKRREKFEAYKDVRETLNAMYSDLVIGHSNIQRFYVENRERDCIEKILDLKEYHWKVMEIYKEFRIYFGNLMAYELQSAVYNYYYEFARVGIEDEKQSEFYEISYQALRDAYGLMINDVKLGLASVKFITDVNDNLKLDRQSEYKKYSDRLKKSIQINTKDNKTNNNKETPLSKAASVLEKRTVKFEEEYKEVVEKK
jgi:hypothetical protein